MGDLEVHRLCAPSTLSLPLSFPFTLIFLSPSMSSARSPSVAAPELPLNVAVMLRTVLRLGRGLRAAADAGADAARRWVADFVPPVVRAFPFPLVHL